MALTARWPWWVGAAMAITAYLALGHFAGREVAAPGNLNELGANVTNQVWRGLAYVGQYILPIVFLAGAAMSAFEKWKRRALFDQAAEIHAAGVVQQLKWQEFEALMRETFERSGYAVVPRGGRTPDGGVDLELRKDGQKALVQCKHWRGMKVPVQTVRELYGVMAAEGAAEGFVVTSGQFTQDSRKFAEGRNINLIDGAELQKLFAEVRRLRVSASGRNAPSPSVPDCPNCTKPMVKRAARKGVHAGRDFRGCSDFPKCRGTRP